MPVDARGQLDVVRDREPRPQGRPVVPESGSLLPIETLADRCRRHAAEIAAYERDITDRTVLDLTAIRKTLTEAAAGLAEADRMLTAVGQ